MGFSISEFLAKAKTRKHFIYLYYFYSSCLSGRAFFIVNTKYDLD